jgi:branched-subunit amino acid transport protein AzlD
MSTTKLIICIAIMAAITFGTRLFPFVVFGRGDKPSPIILYLGKFLPPAIISAIIVYCFRNITIFSGNHALPEVAAVLACVLLHKKFHNTMISIFCSTAVYMLLLRLF